MKKISKLAGIVAAAALLCGISACDNSETITMTSASIEMVGDPIVTDKAAIFQWKDSVANSVRVTRQAPDEEEVTLADGWILNGFADRVTNKNLLKAGVEYTYRFYNTSDVSSARTTEYTLEKKYSCVERKVTFESIAPAGTKLAAFKDNQIKIDYSEENGKNYLSIYVDEKESGVFIDIEDKTDEKLYYDIFKEEMGGVKAFEYDPYHDYEIRVGKWWPDNAIYTHGYNRYDYWNEERVKTNYYDSSDATKTFDLAATKNNSISFNVWDDYFTATWSGKKDSTYEVSFEAFDNQDKAVTLKKSKLAAADIKNDAFDTYQVTGKISDLIDTTKTAKTIKMILKETAADKTVYESESSEKEIPASLTKYTEVDRLSVSYTQDYNEDKEVWEYKANVTLEGANLPATAKLYYKHSYDQLYKEVTGGLKKDAYGYLVTTILSEGDSTDYDFKAVVTVDNKNLYDWEEGKTEEVAEYYNYNNQ